MIYKCGVTLRAVVIRSGSSKGYGVGFFKYQSNEYHPWTWCRSSNGHIWIESRSSTWSLLKCNEENCVVSRK